MKNRDLISALRARAAAADKAAIVTLLEAQGEELEELYRAADAVRAAHYGDQVHLRGIIEFSNYCRRSCCYCGIRRGNSTVERYRMEPRDIVRQARIAAEQGCGTVVLQSGEDPWYTADKLGDIIACIKREAAVAVTLSIGERSREELLVLRQAGADRFLLRFETSHRPLFVDLHPDDNYDARLECLRVLRETGYQVGSGFMIGLPGSDLSILADDILFATCLDLDMIGCGPFIPAAHTPLAQSGFLFEHEIYFKVMAVLRLLNPRAHIPATTAFDSLVPGGRDRVLAVGANVFMPSVTPQRFRKRYQLYANKPCVDEDAGTCLTCAAARLRRLGRSLASGPGHSLKSGRATEIAKPPSKALTILR